MLTQFLYSEVYKRFVGLRDTIFKNLSKLLIRTIYEDSLKFVDTEKRLRCLNLNFSAYRIVKQNLFAQLNAKRTSDFDFRDSPKLGDGKS